VLDSDDTIQHTGISQWIRMSQFRFTDVKGHHFCCILCNFGEDTTNPKDYAGNFCTFWDETAKIDITPNISASTGPNFINFLALVG